MARLIDLTGKRFGKLTVIKRIENYTAPSGATCARWECQCDCGNTITSTATPLRSGRIKSCGCYHMETIQKAIKKSQRSVEGVRVVRLTQKKRRNSATKYKGVYINKKTGRYYSQISLLGKTICLGTYDTEEKAYKARTIAESILHFPFILEDSKATKIEFFKKNGFDGEDLEEYLGDDDFKTRIEKALEIIKAS